MSERLARWGHRLAAIGILGALSLLPLVSPHAQSTQVLHLKEQTGRPVRVYLGGGLQYPQGKLADEVTSGYHGSIGVGLVPTFMSSGDIELVARGQYDFFSAESDSRPDVTFISAGLDFKLNLDHNQPTNWYMLIGGGFTSTKWSEHERDGLTRAEVTEDHLYGEGGIGVEFIRRGVSPYLMLRLTNVTGQRMGNYYHLRLQAGVKL